ncbi:hypothetical protein HPG69_017282, partial [Diceros bicornis minor]
MSLLTQPIAVAARLTANTTADHLPLKYPHDQTSFTYLLILNDPSNSCPSDSKSQALTRYRSPRPTRPSLGRGSALLPADSAASWGK